MNQVKVLHIGFQLSIGGVQKFIFENYKKIDKTRISFVVAVQRDYSLNYDQEFIDNGGILLKVPNMEKELFKFLKTIRRAVKEHNIDIVHLHLNSYNSFLLIMFKMIGFKKVISHSHNIIHANNLFAKIYSYFLILIVRVLSKYKIACSIDAGNYLYGKKSDFKVFKNAIDIDDYLFNYSQRLKYRIDMNLQDSCVMGHVGKFNNQKNQTFLIDIMSLLPKNYALLLIGCGENEQFIKEKVKKENLADRVHFLGERNDVAELLNAMDIFLFPSIFEGLGMVAIEAQANGLVTICSNFIPDDVVVSNKIIKLELNKNPDVWANYIMNINLGDRNDPIDSRIYEIFSIHHQAIKLQEYYETIYNNYE